MVHYTFQAHSLTVQSVVHTVCQHSAVCLAFMRLQSSVLYYVNHEFYFLKKEEKSATHIAWDKRSDDRFCLQTLSIIFSTLSISYRF